MNDLHDHGIAPDYVNNPQPPAYFEDDRPEISDTIQPYSREYVYPQTWEKIALGTWVRECTNEGDFAGMFQLTESPEEDDDAPVHYIALDEIADLHRWCAAIMKAYNIEPKAY